MKKTVIAALCVASLSAFADNTERTSEPKAVELMLNHCRKFPSSSEEKAKEEMKTLCLWLIKNEALALKAAASHDPTRLRKQVRVLTGE